MNMGIVQNLGAQMVGALLGPLIVVWLANAFGWRTAFYIAGAPGLLMALVIAKYIRDPPQAESTQMPASRSVTTQLGDLLKHGNLRTCIIIGCFICAWYFLLLTFLPLYCVQVLHFSGERMSVVMAANGAAGVVSAVVVPHLSDRIGRRPTLVLFALLSALAPLSVLVAGHSFQVLLALVFVGSMATGTTPLFMGTVPLETVGPRDAAAASGMILAAGSIAGGFIGPALAGVLADRFGMVAPMMLGIGMALAAAFTGLSLRETAPVRGGRVTAFT
jgi:predicted MFS family arabinose efflux permease